MVRERTSSDLSDILPETRANQPPNGSDFRKPTGNKTTNDNIPDVPSVVIDVLHHDGDPLHPEVRASMESYFGHNFRDVRIHTGSRAANSARSIDARAYTVGSDIIFDTHQYDPLDPAGQRLLAHELTHVVQRGVPTTNELPTNIAPPSGSMEKEAHQVTDRVMEYQEVNVQKRGGEATIARRVDSERETERDSKGETEREFDPASVKDTTEYYVRTLRDWADSIRENARNAIENFSDITGVDAVDFNIFEPFFSLLSVFPKVGTVISIISSTVDFSEGVVEAMDLPDEGGSVQLPVETRIAKEARESIQKWRDKTRRQHALLERGVRISVKLIEEIEEKDSPNQIERVTKKILIDVLRRTAASLSTPPIFDDGIMEKFRSEYEFNLYRYLYEDSTRFEEWNITHDTSKPHKLPPPPADLQFAVGGGHLIGLPLQVIDRITEVRDESSIINAIDDWSIQKVKRDYNIATGHGGPW